MTEAILSVESAPLGRDLRDRPRTECIELDPTRDRTDEGLRAERARSDAEFARRREADDAEADARVQLDREKAAAALRAARALADDAMSHANVSVAERQAVVEERYHEDRERARDDRTADNTREYERAARERSLAAIVGAERNSTDQRLSQERMRSDQIVQTRDDFLAVISHDLRNILANISMGAEGVLQSLRRGLDQDATTAAQLIQRNANVMDVLVRDLIDTVALDTGMLRLERRECDARTLVGETCDALRSVAADKGVSLVPTSPDAPVISKLDPVRIFQVICNLVTNSIRYTPPGGSVEIAVAKETSGVRFTVSDTGCGISASVLASVFDRSARRPEPGHLGLGLSIAKGLVNCHGGRIWAESPPGSGVTVSFTVPDQDDGDVASAARTRA